MAQPKLPPQAGAQREPGADRGGRGPGRGHAGLGVAGQPPRRRLHVRRWRTTVGPCCINVDCITRTSHYASLTMSGTGCGADGPRAYKNLPRNSPTAAQDPKKNKTKNNHAARHIKRQDRTVPEGLPMVTIFRGGDGRGGYLIALRNSTHALTIASLVMD